MELCHDSNQVAPSRARAQVSGVAGAVATRVLARMSAVDYDNLVFKNWTLENVHDHHAIAGFTAADLDRAKPWKGKRPATMRCIGCAITPLGTRFFHARHTIRFCG